MIDAPFSFISLVVVSLLLTACGSVIQGSYVYSGEHNLSGHVYSLPKAYAEIEVSRTKTGNEIDEKIVVGQLIYVPDLSYTYSLNHIKNILFEDRVVVETEKGLLKSVSVTTKDKTRDFVGKVLDLVQSVAKLSAVSFVIDETTPKPKSGDPLYKFKSVVDITDQSDINSFNSELRKLGETKLFIDAKALGKLRPQSQEHLSKKTPSQNCEKELCYRIAAPYILELKKRHSKSGIGAIASQLVIVPDPHLTASIRIRRGMFVDKASEFAFSNGILVKSDVNSPSEALGFINIPLDVLRAIIALPSAILDFKVTQINKDQGLISAQTQQIQAQKDLIVAQQELLEKQAQAVSIACVPNDPNC
ncbi:MAG: hypothetical protein K5905_22595 [Roseibium sp.]|uniref:hypothetical protein n=1 Tax=Roseibium sp. TaxID=1936156 RepID=UPI002615996F|nr:hypothetical protein [Roseibium sp.]MCV0428255.1 hypothetical protein [Roseibium sp.]